MLFSAPMVRAILSGQKTQTRRVAKPCKDRDYGCELAVHELAGEINTGCFRNSKYGEPGDRLWVRESLAIHEGSIYYAADTEICADSDESDEAAALWNRHVRERDGRVYGGVPSIHAPRWTSRIDLEISGLRIQRLHEITQAECISEGIPPQTGPFLHHVVADYRRLWTDINGASSWNSNPWVWVVEFKPVIKDFR